MWIVYFVVGLVALVILTMIVASHHPHFKMTSLASGTVTRMTEREIKGDTSRRLETELIIQYIVHGRTHQITRLLQGRQGRRFPVGASVPVYYYPAKPEMARVAVR